jgi:epoxide hydrolase-like predicted phosphatase
MVCQAMMDGVRGVAKLGGEGGVILIYMTIKAIILDLGGVLLRTTDFTPREKLAARLGMSRNELEELIFGGESGDLAQRGDITVQQHWANLAIQLNCSRNEINTLVEEFFAKDEIDHNLIDYVRKLHKSYKTGLLSNAFDDLRQIITERWHFEDAFDDMVISAEVGLVKPDARIFLLATEQLEVDANQAVFVDDMRRNIEGAKRVGLIGIHFQNPSQVRHDIENLLSSETG